MSLMIIIDMVMYEGKFSDVSTQVFVDAFEFVFLTLDHKTSRDIFLKLRFIHHLKAE